MRARNEGEGENPARRAAHKPREIRQGQGLPVRGRGKKARRKNPRASRNREEFPQIVRGAVFRRKSCARPARFFVHVQQGRENRHLRRQRKRKIDAPQHNHGRGQGGRGNRRRRGEHGFRLLPAESGFQGFVADRP